MAEESKVYAVLTGDIVGSTGLPPPGLPTSEGRRPVLSLNMREK